MKVITTESDDESASSPSGSYPHTPLPEEDISEDSDIEACQADSEWSSSDENDGVVYVDVVPQRIRRRLSTYENDSSIVLAGADIEMEPEGERDVESHTRRIGHEDSSNNV